MRFTVQKLQRDLLTYLSQTAPLPGVAVAHGEDKIRAVYCSNTKDGIGYVHLNVQFTAAGVTATVEPWFLCPSEASLKQGAELLGVVTDIKAHILKCMVPHQASFLVFTNPVSQALAGVSRWLERLISPVF